MFSSRPTPWIQRWSRVMIGVIALLGSIETAYLTLMKFSGTAVACPVASCNDALSSSYATIFNLPLSLFGCLAYVTMAGLALIPLLLNKTQLNEAQVSKTKISKTQPQQRSQLESLTWWLMFGLSTAMAICSSYLIYLLASELKAFCFYCILSAIFSFSLFILTLIGRDWEDIGQLFFRGLTIGMVTLIGVLGIYNSTQASEPSNVPTEFQITTTSSPAALALARHLKQIGAKQYGAYWCPHCQEQKQVLGQAAFELIDYIECDANGKNAQPQLCRQLGIKSYPTWEIKGQFYSGLQSIETLANLSEYPG
ncbi:MAG: vitamin K epoxide reductase family protein [Microcoleaceae cyanobacterium]